MAAHLSVPVFLADEKGKFVYFNEAAEMLIGQSMEDTVEFGSEDFLEILDPRHDDGRKITADELPVPRAMFEGSPAYLLAVSGKNGGIRYRSSAVPLLDREGAAIGALMFVYEEKR